MAFNETIRLNLTIKYFSIKFYCKMLVCLSLFAVAMSPFSSLLPKFTFENICAWCCTAVCILAITVIVQIWRRNQFYDIFTSPPTEILRHWINLISNNLLWGAAAQQPQTALLLSELSSSLNVAVKLLPSGLKDIIFPALFSAKTYLYAVWIWVEWKQMTSVHSEKWLEMSPRPM